MSSNEESNEYMQPENYALTVGNDGCTVIADYSSHDNSPNPETPHTAPSHSQRNTFMKTIRGVFFDDFRFEETPEYALSLRKVIVDGKDLSSLRPEEIEKMPVEDAKTLLLHITLEGNLHKKGFRGLQMWKRRYFRLVGSAMAYYDCSNHDIIRKQSEITYEGKVMVENISKHPFAFSFQPNKNSPIYMLEAFTMQQRDQWIRMLTIVLSLLRRITCTPSTSTSIQQSVHILDTLGKGRYGVVHLGKSKATGEMVAVKTLNRGNIDDAVLRQELMVLRVVMEKVRSSCIVKVYEVYEDAAMVHVVMEYLGGGDLFHRLQRKKFFSEREAANVVHRIGAALQELHRHHIYHLDVKPENIIYESNDAHSPMKLTDFGCSLIADYFNENTNEIVGTAGYMAPEVITKCAYSEKADIYSLGVTLFVLLMGYPPFSSDSANELLNKTVNERIEYKEEDWSTVSKDALLLVKNMLAKNPEERLSIDEVLSFPWVLNPPQSSRRWERRRDSNSSMGLQMSMPSTLPGSHLASL